MATIPEFAEAERAGIKPWDPAGRHPTQTAPLERHDLHTIWSTDAVKATCLACRVRTLAGRAHGGAYACWLFGSVPPRRGGYGRVDLGAVRLRKMFPEDALGAILVNNGEAAYIVHSSRGRRPCLYLRAKHKSAFRVLARDLHTYAKARGVWLSVLDATQAAMGVIDAAISHKTPLADVARVTVNS